MERILLAVQNKTNRPKQYKKQSRRPTFLSILINNKWHYRDNLWNNKKANSICSKYIQMYPYITIRL